MDLVAVPQMSKYLKPRICYICKVFGYDMLGCAGGFQLYETVHPNPYEIPEQVNNHPPQLPRDALVKLSTTNLRSVPWK